jgi:NADP-dependent 3-hydroxy acid dehydrogenase YdfG
MTTSLAGAVALITGASSGIGAATARTLAAEGATVAIAARRRDRLDDLAEAIRSEGGRAIVLGADITDLAQARGVVDQTVAEAGRLDIVVNNAGVMLLGPATEAPLEEWERMVDLNLSALLHVTHAALPHLIEAADGERKVADLVNISSVAGRRTRAGSAVYNLTKFGVGAVSESLREELSPHHVRVSVVEPGAVATELSSHVRDGVREQVQKRFEGIERLEADDIADTIRFIVTRSAHVAINEVLIRPTEQAS